MNFQERLQVAMLDADRAFALVGSSKKSADEDHVMLRVICAGGHSRECQLVWIVILYRTHSLDS